MILRVENLEGLDRLAARFRRCINPDATGLMQTWMEIIRKDNQAGVLAGLDKDGKPLAPVTYRPIGYLGRDGKIQWQKPSKDQRLGQKASQRGVAGGFGPLASGLNNNLSSSEYRRLTGPPLAPRGLFSRVITNLETEFDPSARGQGRWEAYGYWRDVVDVKGQKFLHYHFWGIGQKRRDLTGVRPDGVLKARKAAVNWMMDIVRSSGA